MRSFDIHAIWALAVVLVVLILSITMSSSGMNECRQFCGPDRSVKWVGKGVAPESCECLPEKR